MKTLKVSLVVSDLSGGGAIRAFLLAQVLRKLDYEVEVIGFLFGENLYAPPPSGIKIFSVPGSNYPGVIMTAQQLINKLDGDIIYAVKPKVTSLGISLLKKLQSRRPVLLDIDDWELSWYGGYEWKYRPTLKQFARDILKKDGALRIPDYPLYLEWMERLVKFADAITIDTRFLKELFGGVYLPNGKDTSMFNPCQYDPEVSRTRYGLADYRILMFPGAPRPHKGVEDVLTALDHLNQPDLRLVIVGGSPYDNYDEQLIEQWGRWIIKLPRLPVEAMPEVVSAAHIVVVPQRDTLIAQAQFPLKLTDGMAMAKPILSTRVGDIPEILGDTGYLVEPGSPEQLAKKIQWIFQHLDAANAQGARARARCIQHYSVDTMAATLADVLAKIK